MAHYNTKDIAQAYAKVGVSRGRLVLLRTDLRWLGFFDAPDQRACLEAHFRTLSEMIDLGVGTLVVPTASISLCNTQIPFHIDRSKSEMGILTEYIRTQPGAVRNFHPFVSYTAIGPLAETICRNTSRHSFGPESPEARMAELDAMLLSVGLHPRFTAAHIHHVEHIMGVPYRYCKEFLHPVHRGDAIAVEPFYMSVRYLDCGFNGDKNRKIFDNFSRDGGRIASHPLGRGTVYSLSLAALNKSVVRSMANDIYIWLEAPCRTFPFRT